MPDTLTAQVGRLERLTRALVKQLDRNQDAWKDEETSVQEEHMALIAANARILKLATSRGMR